MTDGKERWWVRNFLLNDWGASGIYILNYVLHFPATDAQSTSSPPAVPPRPYLTPTVEHERGTNKRRKGNTGAEIGYVSFNMEYPPYDTLLADDVASLQPNHPDERINYDGSFLIPTISRYQTTLYNTAAIFGRGNSNFSPKLCQKTTTTCLRKGLWSTPGVLPLLGANVRMLGRDGKV